ncbi:MAG: class I SAM-dependent methyltransferase [Hyphomicrobiaceae bacterium]
MTSDDLQEYDDAEVFLLEEVWGDGFLSPGGPDEIRKIVDGVAFDGASVLDIGCGTGGISVFLAEAFEPAEVVGVDIDPGLVERANARAGQSGKAARLKFTCVEPGSLPFENASFDVVFSKDAMIHIADKEALFADIFRVLKPGGMIAACDWMSSTDDQLSQEMITYIELENLGFAMASPARYERAMALAGFTGIVMTDRNAWYKPLVKQEIEALSGPLYERLVEKVGQEFVDHSIEVWRALKVVVDSGEHRPTHMRAHKPAA